MEVEEVQRPCERVAQRAGQTSSAAPATATTGTGAQGSFVSFLATTITPVPPTSLQDATAQLADKPTQASAIKTPTPEPVDKPDTAPAAQAPAANVRAAKVLVCGEPERDNQPCTAEPGPLPNSWSVAAKPSATNPFYHTPTCLECRSRTYLQPLISQPYYLP